MIYKNLADTDVRIPAIAQGTTRMGTHQYHDDEAVRRRIHLLRTAVDLGSSFIDTGELYGGGFAEEVVGDALQGMRDKIFLASKFNPRENPERSVAESLEGSLRRLRTDHLDLYQVHWPNLSLPLDELMTALSRLVDEGKVRFVGLSNHTLRHFQEAQALFDKHLVSNQVEYSLADRSAETDFMDYSVRNGVTLLAYSVFNQGSPAICGTHAVLLSDLAEKYGKTIYQIVLRWAIHHPSVVVLTKTQTAQRLKENSEASDFDMEEDDYRKIGALTAETASLVPISTIDLGRAYARPIYTSLEHARENRLDLIPSPINLAKLMTERAQVKPIRLEAVEDGSSYGLDPYDLMDQVKKYWAWIIAFGEDRPIPALIRRPQGLTS